VLLVCLDAVGRHYRSLSTQCDLLTVLLVCVSGQLFIDWLGTGWLAGWALECCASVDMFVWHSRCHAAQDTFSSGLCCHCRQCK